MHIAAKRKVMYYVSAPWITLWTPLNFLQAAGSGIPEIKTILSGEHFFLCVQRLIIRFSL